LFKVLSTGFQTTFQDMGRFGYRDKGIPVSGVMDRKMAQFANATAGNDDSATLIEFTVLGPTIEVLEAVEIVIAGIGFSPRVAGEAIPVNELVKLDKGDQLKIGQTSKSMRGYLAVKGGFFVPKILGSSSFYEPITPQLKIDKNSIIESAYSRPINRSFSSKLFDEDEYKQSELSVYKGPEFELLTEMEKEQLLRTSWTIGQDSNRMATLLKSDLQRGTEEIITAPVQPGTVQLTPSGKLIVLMRDAQTTGGYARILQLSNEAINILVQKPALEQVSFKLI
jgi:antagonist of KipI